MPANSPDQTPSASRGYRFLRALLRIWFGLVFRRVRLLRGEAVPSSGAVILAVSHPGSLLDALILVAALERPICCLLNQHLLGGYLRDRLARWLGMIIHDPERETPALQAACEALGRHEAVVVFTEHQAVKSGEMPRVGLTAARLAIEAEARHSGQLGLLLFPVHLFLPVGRSQSSELLIYVDSPLPPKEYLSAGEGAISVRRFGLELDEALQQNAFRLQPSDLRRFLADLEEVLRADLGEEWAARPEWKQKVEAFKISQFIAEWFEQLNSLNPGRLVALRDGLDAYREQRRRWSLRQAEVEAAGWHASRGLRVWYWLESVAGLPLAVYGLLNHLLVWMILFWAGLLRKESEPDRRLEWLLRALVVVGCYAAQALLCAFWLDRATAGYYALTLPLAGAFLWRYEWLLRARTRLLLVGARLPHQAAKLRRQRRRFVEELNAARDAYAETLGIPH